MSGDAIVPVGKDCDCGHPLIWRRGRQICAVYGRHPADQEVASWGDAEARLIHYRNRNAPGAALIEMSLNTVNNAPGAVRSRRNRTRYAQSNPHGCATSDTQTSTRTMTA